MQALLRKHTDERKQRKSELDIKVEAALNAADEIEANVTALFGKELVQVSANQRHLDMAVRELNQNLAVQTKGLDRFSLQYDALVSEMAEAGGVGEWLRTMEVGLQGTLSLLVAIERRLTQTDG